jgi:lipopolysaccharide export system permease protein
LSVLWLSSPVILLSLLMCGLCAWFNCEVSPRCRVAFLALKQQALELALRPGGAQMALEGQYVEQGPYTLYAARVRDGRMEDILVFQLSNGRRLLDAHAASGEYVIASNLQSATLILHDVQGFKVQGSNDFQLRPFYYEELVRTNLTYQAHDRNAKPKYSDMTFRQLWAERRDILDRRGEPGPIVLQLHRQVSFSFACFGFTLLGIPLGLRGHRRETNVGVGLSLLLMIAYYAFIILGQALATKPHLHPYYIFWIPNFLFQGLGAWLLWRADQVGR